MLNIRLGFFILFFAALVYPAGVFAYGQHATHPALTQEIVDFYNSLHPGDPLSREEKEWLMKGSILEDTPPRAINHLYDPVRDIAWNGENFGIVSPETANKFIYYVIMPEKPLKATDWVNNRLAQGRYYLYGGDRTWAQALDFWADDDKREAYITLGYVLHLLEDLGVPDHTRNDPHPPLGKKVTGDPGSPYENFAKRYTPENIKQALGAVWYLENKDLKPPVENTIEDYLVSLAKYSNKYFFSRDSIDDASIYYNGLPEIVREDSNFGYGLDENGEEFPLAKKSLVKINGQWATDYLLDSYDDNLDAKIFNAYFARLSRQTVLHGAGVIELFHKQAKDTVINKEYPAHLVEFDPPKFLKILGSTFSPAAELLKFWNGAGNLLSVIIDGVVDAWSELAGLINDTFGTGDGGFELVGEVPLGGAGTFDRADPSSLEGGGASRTDAINATGVTIFCSYDTAKTSTRNELVINEVAWMGTKTNANAEWLELKNISGEPLDISGYQIIDQKEQIKSALPERVVLQPGEFILLERGEDALSNIQADLVYKGALSNTDEGLRLFAPNCELQDEATASPDWPAGDNETKQTMERGADLTWHTSVDPGGTPKAKNSDVIDKTDKTDRIDKFYTTSTVATTTVSASEFSGCSDGQINVNSAESVALQEIVGIGPVYAGRIIELREGELFYSIDDLIKVSGIAEGRLADIKSQGLACAVAPDDNSFTSYQEPTSTSGGSTGTAIPDSASEENGASSELQETAVLENNSSPLVLISEFRTSIEDNPKSEFVELYNAGDAAVDLTGWDLKKKTSSGNLYNLATKIEGEIQPRSFFLIASGDYTGPAPDFRYTQASNSLADSNNAVLVLDASDKVIDEVWYESVPSNESLERKATSGGNCVLPQSDGEFLGNACDTGSLNDFVSRTDPDPQNTKDLPEPREALLAAKNFTVSYNSDASELTFLWEPVIFDGSLTYRIEDINPIYAIIAKNISGTSFIKSIAENEKGKSYKFALYSVDRAGMTSDAVTANVDIPAAEVGVKLRATPVTISEVFFNAKGADGGKEFVELYDTTNHDIDLTDWRLLMKKESADSTSTLVVIGSKEEDKVVILTKGFFLMGLSNFASENYGVEADVVRSPSLLNGSELITLILLDDSGREIDSISYDKNSIVSAGESLERMAIGGLQCVSPANVGEFLGNGCDRNESVDFVSRSAPGPQNSGSFPEPREVPTAVVIPTVVYNPDSLAISFDWEAYVNYAGATSTNTYEIKEYNSPGVTIYNGFDIGFGKRIDEVGRSYAFSFQAFDRDGLGSETVTSTLDVSSFLDKLYFYPDPRVGYGRYVLDMHYNKYPFVPDIYRDGATDIWKLVLFYLGSEPSNEGALSTETRWTPEDASNLIKLRYGRCSGSKSPGYPLILSDGRRGCSVFGGGLNPQSTLPGEASRHKFVEVSTLPLERGLVESDYVSAAFYSFHSSGAGLQRFRLAAIDKTKYYFQNEPPQYESPAIGDFSLNFNDKESLLSVSWSLSLNWNSLGRGVIYEINFSPALGLDDALWEDVGTRTSFTARVAPGDDFIIAVRAKDDFGNYSEVVTAAWAYSSVTYNYSQSVADGWSRPWGNKNGLGQGPFGGWETITPDANFLFNKAVVRLNQQAGADYFNILLKVYPDKDGSADTASPLAQTKLSSMFHPDPEQDITFTFDTPVTFTANQKYWLELNTSANDSRAYYRNRWQNAVDVATGDWYLKLGLGVGG